MMKLNPEQLQVVGDRIRDGSTLYFEAIRLAVDESTLRSSLRQVLGMDGYAKLMDASRLKRAKLPPSFHRG